MQQWCCLVSLGLLRFVCSRAHQILPLRGCFSEQKFRAKFNQDTPSKTGLVSTKGFNTAARHGTKLKEVFRLYCAFVFAFTLAWAGPTASEITRQIFQVSLDPGECYRVIEQNFSKADFHIYFTSGYLIFSKPINGIRTSAVFTTEVEGGDAEILLLPPVRSERLSLATFTESPNLEEHFKTALMVFTDQTASELIAKLRTGEAKKSPEMGALLADKWGSLVRNMTPSFQVRLVEDTLNQRPDHGFFYMAVAGSKLGNFDAFCDPLGVEDIIVGQLSERQGRSYFDVWTTFASREKRKSDQNMQQPDMEVQDYHIDATLEPDLSLKTVTKLTAVTKQKTGRAIPFSISKRMKITEARVDDHPVEVFQQESLRSNLIGDRGDNRFLLITSEQLQPGKHEFEFHHEGQVISKAGEQVYYVGSRGFWYPRVGLEFARYDLTFRYPKNLAFVATGDIVNDTTDGDWRITQRRTSTPIRFAGFNLLSDYKTVSIAHDGYKVDVYANRRLETALQPKSTLPVQLPSANTWSRRRPPTADSIAGVPPPPLPPDPLGRLKAVADDVVGALGFMTALFGPPPIKSITVSPIPGSIGQGFPGLLYVSTLAYIEPAQRPPMLHNAVEQAYFTDVLEAHEVAHQWWGNLVITRSYQDAWLMEALANYSALLFLEKKKGTRAMDTVLEDWKVHLLAKGPNGRTIESAGPITWGYRLESSQSPDAWRHITYEKGAWVLHMLRRQMGDERFLAMLKTLCKRYAYRPMDTEEFRDIVQEFASPRTSAANLAAFFDTWIYGTGIPVVKMNYAVRGGRVNGTILQSEVAEDFTARVPLEIQTGKQRVIQWVATGNEPMPFSIPVKMPPARVAVAFKDALITAKKP
jgi:hypothetical protein